MTSSADPDAIEALRPYRHLAVRVLARAFMDLTDPARSPADRESARLFLAGSGLMCHWCRVAALDPGWIVKRAQMVLGLSPLGRRRNFFQMGSSDALPRQHTIRDS